MNKIFKIVFNAARGKMMVVNEATSSVQTGKKAAVTVALVAGLGCISVANAADLQYLTTGSKKIAAEYLDSTKALTELTIDGGTVFKPDVASNNNHEGDVIGGVWIGDPSSEVAKLKGTVKGNTSIEMTAGKFEDIVGGGLIREITDKAIADSTLESVVTGDTSIVLTDVTSSESVIGGGKSSVKHSCGTATIEGDTNVTINSGSIIDKAVIGGGLSLAQDSGAKAISDVKGNTNVQILAATVGGIVGGGAALNHYSTTSDTHVEAHVGNTTVTISEGVTINSLKANGLGSVDGVSVIGGGLAFVEEPKNDKVTKRDATAEAKEAKIVILGGEFSGDIYAGGFARGKNAQSTVESTNIEVIGATVEKNLYAGGYADKDGKVIVSNGATISLKNATVNEVYGASNVAGTLEDVKTDLLMVNGYAEKIVINQGSVELRAEGKEGLTTVADLVSDVDVVLTADGEANDAAGGDVTKLIKVAKGLDSATIAMEEGMTQGAVTGTLEGDVVKVTQATNSVMSNTLDFASAAPLAMNRLLMNDVRKRMGDLRASEGTHGVWARYDGGKLSGANSLENDFTTVQVGIDTVPVVDAPRFGVAFAYTTSDADMKRGGAEMDAFSLAFYGTKFYDNGMFVDVIGRMATADTDVVIDGDKKGSMDNVALSLSGELGWRFDVTEKFYFEPQAELTYTYVNADTLKFNEGTSYEFDSVDSLMGRVGFAAGFKCPNNFGDVYVRASAVHEFLGDAAVTGGNGNMLETNGEDTWVEFGVGANFNINKNTYVYADIERTEGAKLEEDWRANVGVRYAF